MLLTLYPSQQTYTHNTTRSYHKHRYVPTSVDWDTQALAFSAMLGSSVQIGSHLGSYYYKSLPNILRI